MKKVVDLSHIYDERLSKYDEEDVAIFRQIRFYEEHGYKESNINVNTHVGTHMDAPSHIFPNLKNIDDIGVENFVGKALIINIDGLKEIGIEVLNSYEKKLKEVDFVIFNTNWDRYWGEKEYYDHPYLSLELAERIIEFSNIKGVGIDTFSVDKYGDYSLEAHKTLLKTDRIFIMENLCNLSRLENEIVNLIALPLNIKGFEGGPIRVIVIE